MRIIDLTRTVSEGMPVFPGTGGPSLAAAATLEKDGFRETLLRLTSHTGTHMDAPAHVLEGGATLDEMPASQIAGKAAVIDCRSCAPGSEIPLGRILAAGDAAREAQFLLFLTGWGRHWGSDAYFRDYPLLSREALQWIAASGKKGIGLDAASPDPVDETALTRHRLLLSGGSFVIVENLCRLEELPGGLFDFFALPLKFRGADGAPVRAVAVLV